MHLELRIHLWTKRTYGLLQLLISAVQRHIDLIELSLIYIICDSVSIYPMEIQGRAYARLPPKGGPIR